MSYSRDLIFELERQGHGRTEIGIAAGYQKDTARQAIFKIVRDGKELPLRRLRLLRQNLNIDLPPLPFQSSEAKDQAADTSKMHGDFSEFVPVFDFHEEKDGTFSKHVVRQKDRPPLLRDVRGAYAIYVNDASMEPRYQQSWLLWVNPGRPPAPGRDALVYPRQGRPVVRRLLLRQGKLVATPWRRGAGPLYEGDEIAECHLIVGVDQED